MSVAKTLRQQMRKQKDDLVKRRETGITSRSSGRWGTIFNKNLIPKGRDIWVCKEGGHIIDTIPFIAGPDFPSVARVEEGDVEYVLDLWAHQSVGVSDEQFVCPSFNFKKPCPICEYLKEKKDAGEKLPKEQYDSIRAKHRTLYLIWNHDSPEMEQKGLQIWEIAYFFLQEKLDEISRNPLDGGIILFEDPDIGKLISFKRKGSGQNNTQFLGHMFLDRKISIPDEILEQSFSLDSIVNMHPEYDEIHKAFYEKPSQAVPQEEAGVTDQEQTTQEAGADGVVVPEVVGQEDSPIRERECPGGGTFGVDIDQLDLCANQCPEWDDCDDTNRRIKKAEAQKPALTPAPAKETEQPKVKPKLRPRARS